jgi:hypothetical protein
MKGSLHPNAIGLTSYVNFETYIQSSSIVKGYITSTHTKLGKNILIDDNGYKTTSALVTFKIKEQ